MAGAFVRQSVNVPVVNDVKLLLGVVAGGEFQLHSLGIWH